MDNDSALPMRPKHQASLRSLFAWTFCIAAGLTVGVRGKPPSLDWWQALLAAASAALAIGLARQASAIRRHVRGVEALEEPSSFAARFECTWRLTVALLIVIWLVLQFLLNRGHLEFPEDNAFIGYDLLTTYPLWLLVLISLGEAVSRTPIADSCPLRRRLISAVVWTGMGLFGCYVIIDRSMVHYLVYLAMRGVDATLTHTGNRYPLWTPLEQTQFMLLAVAAVAAVLSATMLLSRALRLPASRLALRRALAALGVALLATAAGYNWWYYQYAYTAVAPDFADVGLASNGWQQLGGVVLVVFIAAVQAARLTKSAARALQTDALQVDLPPAADSIPVVLLLLSACVYWLVQMIRSLLGASSFLGWDGLPYLLAYPDTAFFIAMAAMAFQLGRRRLKGKSPGPLKLVPFSPGRFATAWLSLVAILAIGVPTLAAFSFSFWLGPWYRW